jgi:NADPH-dependent curcumin reductase CurA
MCGQISQYNNATPYPFKNISYLTLMRIKMQGFIVLDYAHRWAEARKELASWVKEGKVKTTETTIKGGLRVAEQALVDLYKGINKGKLMVEVKSSDESPFKL